MLKWSAVLASLWIGMIAAPVSAQQTETGKVVRLIVPFPPGNASDLQARALSEQMRKAGARVAVENRPGASGAIALEHVLRSPPDGSTILVASLSPIVITPATSKSLPYDVLKDFSGVALLGFNDVVMLASPKFGPATVAEVVAAARAKPGSVSYASIGQGTLAHMVMAHMASKVGVDMQHVPYKGSAQALPDLAAGDVSLMLDGMPQSLPHVESGRLKAIATLGRSRSQFVANLPTVAESGVAQLADVNVVGWTGVLVSSATPKAKVAELNADIIRMMASPEIQTFMRAQRLQIYPPHTAEDFDRQIRVELDSWRAVAKAAGLEPQ
jgi:tripartite-type tricarboxylate transporter receptor subunit TctC